MAPKPLSIVKPTGVESPSPPRPLGKHGGALWERVQSEYRIIDVGGVEMLAQACAALDRAEMLREEIERDGAIIRTKAGLKEHPGLRHELAARGFVVRTLHRLGLDVEPIGAMGRPAGSWNRG